MLFTQMSNNGNDICAETQSRGEEACLPRAVWLTESCGVCPGGQGTLALVLSLTLSPGHHPWGIVIVRVDVVASPFALLGTGVISIRGEGRHSGGEGEQRRVGWLWALELPEYAERL